MSGPIGLPPSEAPTIQPPQLEASLAPHGSTIPGADQETHPGQGISALTTGHPAPADMWFQPGTVIADAFRVERELGRGAMGVVVLATHLALDRRVALKVHRAHNPADVSRLAREAKAMAKVRHPNVVGIYDVRESGGSLFIAMEYIEGSSARRWLARPGIGWRQRLDVCVQAAEGLHAAHQAGLVHRDFKPENILIGADGRVLVADFGLARSPGAVPIDPATPSPGIDAQLTAVGQVTGTPAYMSPEQWSGGAVDARADVFALSVVIYESLYGRRPFSGKTAMDLMQAITHGMMLGPPHETEVPRAVFEVLRRGMAVDARHRYASVALLLRALRAATSSAGRAGIALAVGLAVLVFGGIGTVAWVLRTRTDATTEGVVAAERRPSESVVSVVPTPPATVEPRAKPAEPRPAKPKRLVVPKPKPEPETEFDVPTSAEIDAAQLELDALKERYAQGLATQEEFIAGVQAMHDLLRRSRDQAFTRTPWDGKSTFVCKMGERVELRDMSVKLDTTAIKMELGCGLKLVNVDIEAPVAIHGMMADRLIIDGGTFDVTKKGIEISSVEFDIRDLAIKGESPVAIGFGMHTLGTIANSALEGLTALRAGMHSRVEVHGGTLVGKVAVDAQMASTVRLRGVTLDGKVKRGPKSRVEM